MSGRVDVKDWLTEDSLTLLSGWARDLTLQDIAENIGIAPSTLWAWRQRYPEIDEAISKSAEITNYKVENALLRTALGYKTKEVKTILGAPDAKGNRKIVKTETIEKEVAPNPTSCAIWLNNKMPDKWRKNRDATVTIDEEENKITVNVIRKNPDGKQIEEDEWSTNEKGKDAKRNTRNTLKGKEGEYTPEELEWLEEN